MARATIFDWLRLAGAGAVMFGHSYALTGQTEPLNLPWHTYGVILFFAVSGYLIAGSWRSDPNARRYIEKRVRRIMPALIVVVLLTVLALGPLVTTDPDYFANAGTLKYLLGNAALLPIHDLPGVFEDNRLSAVNGSLWTLPVEVACYAAMPTLVRTGPWLCVWMAVALFANPFTGEVSGFGLTGASSVVPWFLIGAAAKMFDLQPPGLRLPALPADLSYGLYLTAFPVQQTIIMLHPDIAPLALSAASLAFCVPLAWLSWTFVERHLITGGMTPAVIRPRLDNSTEALL